MSDVSSIFKDIESKLGRRTSFKLLYQAIPNVDVAEFHQKCDWKGPTVTILYGKNNTIFGGYTSQHWSSGKRELKNDKHAFLFYKRADSKAKCMFLPVKKGFEHRAITCDAKFGPTFGGGPLYWNYYDLQTFVKGNSKKQSPNEPEYVHLNGSIYINYSYDIEKTHNTKEACSPAKDNINAQTLIVKRLEVYQVADFAEPKHTLWRKQPTEQETQKMKERIESMKPIPGLRIKRYNILLIGIIGSGKSSLYYTLATVFAGQVKISVTDKVFAFQPKSKNGEPLYLRIFDVRGFEEERGYDHELTRLLDGRLPVGCEFPDLPVEEIDEHATPTLNDEIHLVCFVTGISIMDTFIYYLDKRYRDIKKAVDKKGVVSQRVLEHLVFIYTLNHNHDAMQRLPIVVVASKFDYLCETIKEDADKVYTSQTVRDAVEKVSVSFGIGMSHVFPVVHYTTGDEIKPGKDRLALQALDAMVSLIDDYLEHHEVDKYLSDGTPNGVPIITEEHIGMCFSALVERLIMTSSLPLLFKRNHLNICHVPSSLTFCGRQLLCDICWSIHNQGSNDVSIEHLYYNLPDIQPFEDFIVFGATTDSKRDTCKVVSPWLFKTR